MFESVPLKGEFNGSLWTMPVEVRMYLYLAAIWVALAVMPAPRIKAMRFVLPISAGALLAIVLSAAVDRRRLQRREHSRLHVPLRIEPVPVARSDFRWVLGCSSAFSRRSALASFDKTVFSVVYVACLAPLVLHLVYVPGGRIRAFNDWGDYSYGVYIYAFPVQQTLAFLFPAMTLGAMMASSAVVSVAIAILSWKLIEERALALKGDCRRGDLARLQPRPGEDLGCVAHCGR